MLAETSAQTEALLALGRESMRFAELPAALLSIRNALAEIGIGRGDLVASALPRGAETAMCFLGVASCATYVPLNPDYTDAEFAQYLARLRPGAIIVPEASRGAAEACAATLGIAIIELRVDPGGSAGTFSLVPRAGGHRRPATPAWSTADDIALVLLTSGTNEQKFVPIRQRHMLAYACASLRHYGFRSDDRCLHVMPMFHGHGLKSSLVVPLVNGSGVICSREFDIPSFFRQMSVLRPTWYSAASSIHHAIFQRIDEFRDVAKAAKLRYIRSGSGRLDPKVMAGLEEAFGAPMLERYGMSETCTLTSNPPPPAQRKPGTVGKPMFNEVAIIDETGRIVVGADGAGEIVARGPGVFDGYLDDADANAAVFVDGWFRTGDLGRFDQDGYLTLIGRIKDVVNRGGEKIGTIEVEAALLRHPAVADACVFPLPHPTLGEEVGAAVVLSPNLVVNERELRAHARAMLTGFKVPRRIFFLSSLPKSATNKVQRGEVARICRDLADVTARSTVEPTQPWSHLEREIADLWKSTLNLASAQLERDDDFFLIGGDSLQAYELFALLRKRYRITLGLGHLFDDAATVAGMARLVERGRNRGSGTDGAPRSRLVPIKDDGDRPPLFAVPGSGGNPVGFIHLGRLLDKRQPLIGIESRGIDGSRDPLTRVEDIAADNVAQMRDVQPSGPYFLCGACYGARVAYEMARQLEAAGQPVGLLLMLDPSAPFHGARGVARGAANDGRRPSPVAQTNPRAAVTQFVLGRLAMHAGAFVRLKRGERAAFVRQKARLVRDIIRHRDLFRGDRSEINQRLVYAANREAGQRYVPGRFGGPVVLCFTRDRPLRGERNYRLDWVDVVPQCGTPRLVSGNDSGAMLNLPHVYELAGLVNRWLDEASAGHEPVAPDAMQPA